MHTFAFIFTECFLSGVWRCPWCCDAFTFAKCDYIMTVVPQRCLPGDSCVNVYVFMRKDVSERWGDDRKGDSSTVSLVARVTAISSSPLVLNWLFSTTWYFVSVEHGREWADDKNQAKMEIFWSFRGKIVKYLWINFSMFIFH